MMMMMMMMMMLGDDDDDDDDDDVRILGLPSYLQMLQGSRRRRRIC